jgi:uncharacterized protein YifN (PemK superfamily)
MWRLPEIVTRRSSATIVTIRDLTHVGKRFTCMIMETRKRNTDMQNDYQRSITRDAQLAKYIDDMKTDKTFSYTDLVMEMAAWGMIDMSAIVAEYVDERFPTHAAACAAALRQHGNMCWPLENEPNI